MCRKSKRKINTPKSPWLHGARCTTGSTVGGRLGRDNFHEPLFVGSGGIQPFPIILSDLVSSSKSVVPLSWLPLLGGFCNQHHPLNSAPSLEALSEYRLVIEATAAGYLHTSIVAARIYPKRRRGEDFVINHSWYWKQDNVTIHNSREYSTASSELRVFA